MRLRRFSLDRFGHFTDRVLDFGETGARPDFHIVYGPNEAGKTTTMEAVLRLFYGFKHVEPYAFKHQRANLQVSGEVEIDGTLRSFTRLSKRSGNLVDVNGDPLPEAALAAHLGGMGEDEYRNLLCLDDVTIESGGDEIVQARSDTGRLLFGAAAGVAHLSSVLDSVRAEADAVWRKKSSKTRIAALKRDLAEVEKDIRAQDVTASAWRSLKKAAVDATAAEADANAARDRLQADAAELEGQRRALPLLAEMDALDQQVAPFAAYPDHLGFDLETLVTLKTDQSRIEAEIERLDAELSELDTQRNTLRLSPDLVALSEDLDLLEELRARDVSNALDLPRRRDQLARAEAAMAHAARDLGAPEACDPSRLAPTQAQLSGLDAARDRVRAATAAVQSEAQELADLTDRRDRAKAEVDRLTAQNPARAEVGAILSRHDADRLMPAHATALQAMTSAEQAARVALERLAHPGTRFLTLPDCSMTEIRARELTGLYETNGQKISEQRSARDTHRADAAARRAQADALLSDSDVCPDDRIIALRAKRDRLWTSHLSALTATTAAEFEAAMQALDAAQESRIAHAAELGQLRQIAQAIAEAEARADQAQTRLAELDRDREALLSQVNDAASASGLRTPIQPGEWLDWVLRQKAAQEAELAAAQMRDTHAATVQRAQALLDAIMPHLDQAAPDVAGAVAAARRLAEAEHNARERLAAAKDALQRADADLAKRADRFAACQNDMAQAETAWRNAVTDALGTAVAPELLLATLDPLRALAAQNATRAEAAQRVGTMERDQALFAEKVAALAAAHGLALGDTPADSFARLRAASDAARHADTRAQELESRIKTARHLQEEAGQRLEEIARTVEVYGAEFPTGSDIGTLDALRATAKQAASVIEKRQRRAGLALSILSELGVDDLVSARAALDGESLATLNAKAGRCKDDLTQAEQHRTAATEARVTALQALARITGDADIASLTEQRATLQLQLQEAARDYLELSFGHRLADTAIRRYRDTHRSGMMAATERCFAGLTQGAYTRLTSQADGNGETLLAVDAAGATKRVADMSKGTRFQLYLALRAAAHEQLVAQGTCLPFFCDDIFETFDEHRTSAACRVMEQIGRSGQAIYLTHHRHVVEIAQRVCDTPPILHEI
ncbi:ATP-binding protein [Roseinatronobacter sp.]|uniref:ATP-binding protein n=1 Tax=Roseinatronobacter sp. TaxID=1945755 RepID=UPI0025F5FF88|nr:YhaN family protein [Roseibaca sp.]